MHAFMKRAKLLTLALFILIFLLLSISCNAVSEKNMELSLIPMVAEYQASEGSFVLSSYADICVLGSDKAETEEITKIGEYLADEMNPSTGFQIDVEESAKPSDGDIFLTTLNADEELGAEGYTLIITENGVNLSAYKPEGLFRGIQTIRQLFPAEIEKETPVNGVDWIIDCASITDYPTYSWRGMMLDVARHFIEVEDVKRVIDLIAQYKMNRFHLHLTDDQGWRIEIKSWPELTKIGGSSQIGGGEGGFYTQEEYQEIVDYAKERYITVIPEIDMPGHMNAALASYANLNPDNQKKELYTGIEVGFSSLMCRSEATYTFVDDVIRELAAMTPGEYIHIGGDEASVTTDEDYDYFITRVNNIAASYGKKTIGWNPFEKARGVTSDSLLQHWQPDPSTALSKDMPIIMSPPDKTYIDMKYDENSPLGLYWAGYITTDTSYQWDPTDYIPKENIAGIECPLWSETINTMDDIEYLAFPRLLSHAEIGWTDLSLRNWDEYKLRLSRHALRMDYQDIDYYHDPVVPWTN